MVSRITTVVVLALAAAMVFLLLEQRAANDRILSTLNDVNAALANQAIRARELEQQVATLSGRLEALEKEVIDLRRRVVQLSRRRVEVASAAPLAPVVPLAPFAPYAPYAPGVPAESVVILETLLITWSTDHRSFQPAGIIAPPASIVLERKLTDPSFVKKLYLSYAALQVTDLITTTTSLSSGGAREGNPLLRGVAHSPAALIGVKAATTAATIFTIEKLRKKNPVAASITLIVMNATMAAVTINNVAVSSQNRGKP